MYHPTTRLLTVLELLQTHGQMSGTELAARLEVDARTIRRYILMLQDVGIPIEAEMGRHGGYALRPSFKLPPMMFTNDEALALILGLMTVRGLGLTAGSSAVEGAAAKLYRVLPENLSEQIQATQRALIFDVPAPNQWIDASALLTLGQAVHDRHRVAIVYQKGDEISQRAVDPYGLVCYDRVWYLIGYCHLRDDTRVFRLDRITRIEAGRETFTPPADFDSLAYLIQSIQTIPDRWAVEVVLKTTFDQAAKAIPAGMGVLESHPDGLLFRTEVPDMDWMARYLVGLGFPVIVCQPPELRAAFERLAMDILGYARPD
jgi:predicted DNA-binding transcriptional regulator YafY